MEKRFMDKKWKELLTEEKCNKRYTEETWENV